MLITRKSKIILSIIVITSALLLGLINFMQGYKNIITYMDDYHVTLTKEAVFDRIFVNTNFAQLEYMEGNSLFHLISPFTFYLLATFWGAFYFLILKKNYHQFVYSRINIKKDALKMLRGSYIQNCILFVSVYVSVIFLLLYVDEVLLYQDMLSFIKKNVFFILSSTLITMGLSSLMFYIYLKFNEIIALLTIFISILFLFIIDLNWAAVSIVLIGEDSFFIGGIITGLLFMVISHLFLMNLKYEIE